MGHVVRAAQDDEQRKIGEVLVASYREFAPRLGPVEWERMRTSLAAAPTAPGPESWLVADRDGALEGVVAYIPPGRSDVSLFDPGWASVRLLGVRADAQGGGVGRMLATACVDRAIADDAGHVGLHTSELMTAAQALYEDLGFRRLREIPRRFGVRYWVYVLEL